MDALKKSCEESVDYPRNLIYPNTFRYNLDAYYERLKGDEDWMFHNESKAKVQICEVLDKNSMLSCIEITNNNAMREYLNSKNRDSRLSGGSRFMFVNSAHSRDKLKVSSQMMTYYLSFLQVMPEFLDFLFTFGEQHTPQDFQHSDFRYRTSLSDNHKFLSIPELGRSDHVIQICYSLKSVEASKRQKHWPWSIRQTAVFHSFDTDSGYSEWIMVKGNGLIRDRLVKKEGLRDVQELDDLDPSINAYAFSLRIHIIMCDWSVENWRWYIKFLEEQFETLTGSAITVNISRTLHLNINKDMVPSTSVIQNHSKCEVLKRLFLKQSSPKAKEISQHWLENVQGTINQSFKALPSDIQVHDDRMCGFDGIQRIHFIEEMIKEAISAMEANFSVMNQIKDYYLSEKWPRSLKDSQMHTPWFGQRLNNYKKILLMQQNRANLLLNKVADRKSLLHSILEYHSLEANRILAEKSQESSDALKSMTEDMQDIAQKTKHKTVSMHIITLVTLFYLPGTFFSAIMNTDIIKYNSLGRGKSERVVQLDALKMYVAVTLPLTIGTILVWYLIYFWAAKDRRGAAGRSSVKQFCV